MIRITVHSYKGGTGKTTIATNLANRLADEGNKVLLVETDYLMPVYHGIFSRIRPTRFFNELYENSTFNIEEIIHSYNPRLDIIFSNPEFKPDDILFKMNQDQFGRKIKQLLQSITSIQDKYDYLLFDTSPGWSFTLIGNLLVSDIAFVILRPNIYEVQGTIRLINEIYRKARLTKDLQIFVLFNQIPNVEHGKRYLDWKSSLEREKISILAEIDCSCELSRELGWGITLVAKNSFLYKNLTPVVNFLEKRGKIKD
ncbi:MAG: ParA family protein [Candidatus Odinarchaeota archaeon]